MFVHTLDFKKQGCRSIIEDCFVSQQHLMSEAPDICENCGEYYLDEETTKKVLQIAQQVVERNVELEICDFAA